jgi:hypothetical protein
LVSQDNSRSWIFNGFTNASGLAYAAHFGEGWNAAKI